MRKYIIALIITVFIVFLLLSQINVSEINNILSRIDFEYLLWSAFFIFCNISEELFDSP